MSACTTGLAGDTHLADRYEALRRAALGQSGGLSSHGFGLLQRSGMVGWIRAWADCRSAHDSKERSTYPRPTHPHPHPQPSALVSVLSEMAMVAAQQQVQL